MTAFLVWQDSREPMTEAAVQTLGFETGSTKMRAVIHADLGDLAPLAPVGTLWEREAERAVHIYGTPRGVNGSVALKRGPVLLHPVFGTFENGGRA